MDYLALALTIAVAGGLGSVLRVLIMRWDQGPLHFGLITTNTLAAVLIGILATGMSLSLEFLTVAIIGFAGGLSTLAGISQSAWQFYHNGRLVQMLLTLITNTLVPLTALLVVFWLV
jgi:fluoride ion exporter CrcB/FEX